MARRFLLFALLLFLFPAGALAVDEPDTSSCDEGTVSCVCPPNVDTNDEGSLGTVETANDCRASCTLYESGASYSDADITGYALICDISGTSTTLTSGTLASAFSVDEPDASSCDSGSIACSCPPAMASSEAVLQAADTATDCWNMCTLYEQSISYSSTDITGYALTCTVGGTLTALTQGALGASGSSAGETVTEVVAQEYYSAPTLGVEIPGLTLSDAYNDGDTVQVNYLAEYVNGVYNWLISAAALIAVIMMMIGGMQYVLARGDSGKIGEATDRIKHALIGITLLIGAYTIAYTIDPNTTSFSTLDITHIDYSAYDLPQPDMPGEVDLSSAAAVATSQGILPGDMKCQGATVEEIALSSVGKVTYRYGAKGTNPPYSAEKKVDSSGVPYSTYCPSGTVCYDCSGFANYIAKCAGLTAAGETGGTSEIFSTSKGAQVISSIDLSSNSVNGVALVPGDMVGAPGDHVMIYIGNGQIADSHAGKRLPGDAIGVYPLSDFGTNIMKKSSTRPSLYVRRR